MKRGDVISYLDMCKQEKTSLQRGMNFELGKNYSVFLMSVRTGAPYADRIEEGGQVLIYEGHDSPKARGGPDPKTLDQPMIGPNGRLTQNGLFFKAAQEYRKGNREPGLVRVYPGLFTSHYG